MRNEPNTHMFHRAFSSRISVIQSLDSSLTTIPQAAEELRAASSAFELEVSVLGEGDVEDQYRAYSFAVSIFTLLAQWKHAIRTAEPDAQRFLAAAKMKASEQGQNAKFVEIEPLGSFLASVASIQDTNDLTSVQAALRGWALPLLMFANISVSGSEKQYPSTEREKSQLTVAFLKFDIDGQPARQWNYLKPATAYDLTVEVRVSNWPEGAEILSLVPITIDSRERDWLPQFKFGRPDGSGPFIFTGTGRAVLEIAHSFGARPYEFLYAAEFDSTVHHRRVEVVGHRRLVLEGSDLSSNPLTGFRNVDLHLLKIRDRLRSMPGINQDDLADAMVILGGFGSIAASALRDANFPANCSEKEFQSEAVRMLRMRHDIGGDLHGHPEAAGGITDLTFHDVPIELKVESTKVLYPKDFARYFDQTAAYAVALGKKIALLAVLESSSKSAPVGNVDDDIDVIPHQIGNSLLAIIVIVIRGGFPKPSSYSKR